MEQKEKASCGAGLLKGIRELGSRPLILQFSLLCQLSLLTLPRYHPNENGFPQGFLLPQEHFYPLHLLPLTQQQSGSRKKNIKIK